MKMFFLGSVFALSLFSCQSEIEDVKISNNTLPCSVQMALEQKLVFSGQEEIKSVLKGNEVRASKNFPSDFVSLTSSVVVEDSILNNLSPSEREYVLNSKESYYELLGYDQYVPNEKLASLLNSRGEIIVGDTLYRITPTGVFFSHKYKELELDSIVSQLSYENLDFHKKGEVKRLSEHVFLRNTFDFTNVEESSMYHLGTRTSVDAIPFSSFPVFGHRNITVAGKLIAGVFGARSVKHHEFRSKHRVAGSLYDYDYGFYYEIGTFVELERKRGGFFSWINGWESINAEELVVSYKNLVIEMDHKIPELRYVSSRDFNIPPNPIAERLDRGVHFVVGGQNYLKVISDEPILSVDVFALNVTKEDLQRIIGYLSTASFHALENALGEPINRNVRAIRFFTPTKSYYAIADATLNRYNSKQFRKVFDSGVRFVVGYSSDGIKASLAQMWKLYQDFPVKDLISGQVRLAAKYKNQWGGMTIFVEK